MCGLNVCSERCSKRFRRFHDSKVKGLQADAVLAKGSTYNKAKADYAVSFIECLCHTKGVWAGKPFELIDWQERIIRDIFGSIKPNGYRQFNTAYIEIPKKQGKSELAAAVALYFAVEMERNGPKSMAARRTGSRRPLSLRWRRIWFACAQL